MVSRTPFLGTWLPQPGFPSGGRSSDRSGPFYLGNLLPQEQADTPRPTGWMTGPRGALWALCLCSSSGTKDGTSSLFWPACHMEPVPGSDPSTMGAELRRREAVGTTLPAPLGASGRCSCRDSQGQTAERRDQCLLAPGEASIATRAARLLRNLGTSKFTEQGKALGNPAGLSSFWLSLGEGQGALGSQSWELRQLCPRSSHYTTQPAGPRDLS